MRISIVMPQGTARRTGNQHTAVRWAAFLRGAGHRVSVKASWERGNEDVLVALHARKSAASVLAFHRAHPDRSLIVALTGTDLYRDIETSAEAQQSLALATRLIVLQPAGLARLARPLRARTSVVFQSSDTRLAHKPPKDRFRVIVVGNLREEKDPFRAVAALALLPPDPRIEVVQVGAALSGRMAAAAAAWAAREPRYRWSGGRPHGETLRAMAQSHLLVVSSVMEGGANVICEAARIGVPVLASKVSGNVGMLGAGHRGYFPLGDERRLARLIGRAAADRAFYRALKEAVRARRGLFSPAVERRALVAVVEGAAA